MEYIDLILGLVPGLKALLPGLSSGCLILLASYVLLREAHIRQHLPVSVQRLLNDQTIHGILAMIAQQVDLDNEAKRAEAEKKIAAYLRGKGVELPDRLIRLLVEMLVHRLKSEGLI